MRRTIRMYGRPHRIEDVFADGKVGFIDFTVPGINVIPGSVSIETLSYPSHNYGAPVTVNAYRIRCADGTVHQMPSRWVRKICYVRIAPDTLRVSWADEDGQ